MDTLLGFEQGVIAAERPFDSTLKTGIIHYYDLHEMITAPHIELLVADLNERLVATGYARIEDSKPYLEHTQYAYLGFMYVVPEFRGLGINQKIVTALGQWAFSKGIKELRLDVYHGNLAAINAYEKVGFSKLMIEMRLGIDELDL